MAMDSDDRTLFIGNLDKNVTEEILYELFLQAGPVERVSIPGSRTESIRYGFVTYKHECSISYAIELFKGTNLFKKELIIKKRCPRNNGNPDCNKFGIILDSARSTPNIFDFQNQLHSLKLLAQNLTYNQPLLNFTSNSLRGDSTGRSRSYDLAMTNHFSRPREIRDWRKDRDYGNKLYRDRKSRHRD